MPIMKCLPLPMKFIGRNGSMGLITGRIYRVVIYTNGRYIYARWGDGPCDVCPYETITSLNNNWEVIL